MVEEAISFWTEIQRFEDMLAADPRSLSFAPLAELYRKLGLIDDAISVAKKGCDLHPDFPGGFLALGAACFDKGLKDQARPALERAVALNPENLSAQKLLGQLYVEQGEIALAQRALEQVLQQNPDDAESALLLRSFASTSRDAAPGQQSAEETEIIEELTEELEELTEVIEESAEYEPDYEPEDEQEDEQEWEPAPQHPSAPNQAAASPAITESATSPMEPKLSEDSDPFEFSEIFEAPRDLAPHPSRDPLTTATLAELYVSQGFLEKAMGIYRELLLADPENAPYRLRLIELKSAQDRQKEGTGRPTSAAVVEQTALAKEAPAPVDAVPADAHAELSRWLDNIRRRRDGL
jgi:tetratricopeptide (TPR) repeat protein